MYLKTISTQVFALCVFFAFAGLQNTIAQSAEYTQLLQLKEKMHALEVALAERHAALMEKRVAEDARDNGIDPSTVKGIRLLPQATTISTDQSGNTTTELSFKLQETQDGQTWTDLSDTITAAPEAVADATQEYYRLKLNE